MTRVNPPCTGSEYIQSIIDISRSKITRYWTQHEGKKAKPLFKPRTHKRHPTPRLYGWAMGRPWRRDNTTQETPRNYNVILTSKPRFDVKLTFSLRRAFPGEILRGHCTANYLVIIFPEDNPASDRAAWLLACRDTDIKVRYVLIKFCLTIDDFDQFLTIWRVI